MSKSETAAERPFWYDGKSVNEVGFCEDFLQQHPMVRVGGCFFTKEGRITDEESVRKEIYEMLRPYLNCGLAKRASGLLEMLKLEAYVPNLPVHEDRLHVANGTLFLNGEFTENKEFCRNRLPVNYTIGATAFPIFPLSCSGRASDTRKSWSWPMCLDMTSCGRNGGIANESTVRHPPLCQV